MGKLERDLQRRLERVEASGRKEAAGEVLRVLASISDQRLVELLCPEGGRFRSPRLAPPVASLEEWEAVGFTNTLVEWAIGYAPGMDSPELRRRIDALLSPLDERLRRCGETYPDRLART